MNKEPQDKTADKVNFFVSVKNVISIFAKWSVRLSPYTVPDDLSIAILKFRDRIEEAFQSNLCMDNEWLQNISKETLNKTIQEIIVNKNFVEVYQWNERKNGISASVGFSSAFSKEDPDNDFIDLHALAMNISRDIWNEGKCEADSALETCMPIKPPALKERL